jgi:hypothetical protein
MSGTNPRWDGGRRYRAGYAKVVPEARRTQSTKPAERWIPRESAAGAGGPMRGLPATRDGV